LVVKTVKAVLALREKISARVCKMAHTGESVTHFLYGAAIFTESHEGVTFYGCMALGLGCFALLNTLLGEGK
jgi:hypothetical protein